MSRARRIGRRLGAWAVAIAVACAAATVGFVVAERSRTGRWAVPRTNDVVRVGEELRARLAAPGGPPRVIYLHREPITLTPGPDAAHANRSSIVAVTGRSEVTMPGFRSRHAKRWGQIRDCVAELFAPFDIEVTDERPAQPGYMMVVVGGRARDLGTTGHHGKVSGLAPFNGEVIADAVVFAFSASVGNRLRPVCETIGMEVAHAYGLDHSFECKDVMTYKTGCGKKRFLDKDVRCGEGKPRDCVGGAPRQNSYRHLLELLGPARPEREPGESG